MSTNVELLLIEDVAFLGKRGERVVVKQGYARNHLLPMNLAIAATSDNLTMVEKRRVQWLAEEAKLIEELKELAGHIAGLDLTIVEKAQAETGHLYGSVTAKDVAAAAASKGVKVDVKHIRLDAPLKEVGDYEVMVRLHEEVEASIPVHVRMEGNEDWLPSAMEEEAPAPAEADDEKPRAPVAPASDEIEPIT